MHVPRSSRVDSVGGEGGESEKRLESLPPAEGPGAEGPQEKVEGFVAWGHLDVYLAHFTLSRPMSCANEQECRCGQSLPGQSICINSMCSEKGCGFTFQLCLWSLSALTTV